MNNSEEVYHRLKGIPYWGNNSFPCDGNDYTFLEQCLPISSLLKEYNINYVWISDTVFKVAAVHKVDRTMFRCFGRIEKETNCCVVSNFIEFS